jgi:hypothetical protein
VVFCDHDDRTGRHLAAVAGTPPTHPSLSVAHPIAMVELVRTAPPPWSCFPPLSLSHMHARAHTPAQDLHPMRALLKIVKSPPPSLEDAHKWSDDFYDFLDVALVKDPELRSVALPSLAATPLGNQPLRLGERPRIEVRCASLSSSNPPWQPTPQTW